MQYLLIPGKPVPKARHKIRLYGGRVLTYTPAKTQEYERAVRLYALKHRLKKQQGDVAVVAIFHTTGPGDLDNLLKSLLDGLNGQAWEDDRQVKALLALKLPCASGQEHTKAALLSLERFRSLIIPLLAEIEAVATGR